MCGRLLDMKSCAYAVFVAKPQMDNVEWQGRSEGGTDGVVLLGRAKGQA